MPAPKCSDEDFVKLWNELGAAGLARHLGINKQPIFERRRRLEQRLGITLKSFAEDAVVETNRAIIQYRIDDGHILVGSDAHIWPGPRPTVQRAFITFAKKLKPLAIVMNGDAFDGSMISRWPSIGWESKPSVRQEIDAVADYLGDVAQAHPAAKRFWPLGNHDARFENKIANSLPEFAKLHGVHLKDHFPHWLPCWRVDVNDDIVIRHRELGGEHADFRNAVTSGKTVITGHDHRIGGTPYRNYRGVQWGIRTGFMGDSANDPQFVNYLEGREPNWHPGFAILTFRAGRMMQPEFVLRVDDDTVEFRGELIKV